MKQLPVIFLVVTLSTQLSAQNIGIGTPTPNHPLTVIADANSKGIAQKKNTVEIGFFTNTNSAFLQTWSLHDLNFATNNGPAKLTLANSNGFFGVNTTLPTAQLDVSGTLRIRGNGAAAGRVLTSDADGNSSWQPGKLSLPSSNSFAGVSDSIFNIYNTSANGSIANFINTNAANNDNVLHARASGTGTTFVSENFGDGGAAFIYSAGNGDALRLFTLGSGTALTATTFGSNVAEFRKQTGLSSSVPIARIDATGKGFFNGGTQTGGADVAEAFAVEGARNEYEPGDVLSISTTSDRTVTKSTSAYSTLVVGVYATKTGVLLTERMEADSQDDLVPMGVIGVIPTKVCNEGGVIHRGDMLVTSSTPGFAMKGRSSKIKPGMVIGKALEDFSKGQAGMIKVLVNVK